MPTSSRHRIRVCGWARVVVLAALSATATIASVAEAAPIVAEGSAEIEADKGVSVARHNALRRARQAALDSALGSLEGPVDKAAKKAVRKRFDAWTGAYRILDQSDAGGKVSVRIEVDVDTVRLGKRLTTKKPKATGSRFRLGDVVVADGCAPVDTAWVTDELSAAAAVSEQGSQAAAIELTCEPKGVVRYTHMQAASVSIVARTDSGVVASHTVTGFGSDPDQAASAGAQRGLEEVAKQLRSTQADRLRVRIESPLPAARVRRLEQAMLNSVPGVDDVSIGAIEPGVVVLSVQASLTAKELGTRLEALRLPDFSVTIANLAGPDALTIRLH